MTSSAFAPLTLAWTHCQRFHGSIPGAVGAGEAWILPGRDESPGDPGRSVCRVLRYSRALRGKFRAFTCEFAPFKSVARVRNPQQKAARLPGCGYRAPIAAAGGPVGSGPAAAPQPPRLNTASSGAGPASAGTRPAGCSGQTGTHTPGGATRCPTRGC